MIKKMLIAGAVMMVLGAGLTWLWVLRPLIPPSVRRQVSFVVLAPSKNNPAHINRASIKYDSSNKILTYNARFDSSGLIVTNQATPETFTDVPQYFDKVVEQMHSYATIDAANGKVSLTRPPNSDNQQVAVANAQGTLMFVRADHDLSDDQWRKFFNNLDQLK